MAVAQVQMSGRERAISPNRATYIVLGLLKYKKLYEPANEFTAWKAGLLLEPGKCRRGDSLPVI